MICTLRDLAITALLIGIFPTCGQAGGISTAVADTSFICPDFDSGAIATASMHTSSNSSGGSAFSRVDLSIEVASLLLSGSSVMEV